MSLLLQVGTDFLLRGQHTVGVNSGRQKVYDTLTELKAFNEAYARMVSAPLPHFCDNATNTLVIVLSATHLTKLAFRTFCWCR